MEINKHQNDIMSITIGKKYLYMIVERLTRRLDIQLDEIKEEVDSFVNGIGFHDVVDEFKLAKELHNYIYSEDSIKNVKYLDWAEEDFSYQSLIVRMRRIYEGFCKRRKPNKTHLWLALKPQQHFNNDNRGIDGRPNFDSILSKSYYSKFKNYIGEENTSERCWTTHLCLTYLIVLDGLYRILEPYNINIGDFLFESFNTLNPIITGLTVTLEYNLGEIPALSVLYELMQLVSNERRLSIYKNYKVPCIKFCFTTETGTFDNSINNSTFSYYKGDKTGKRLVELLITGEKTTLKFKIDMIGSNVIQDITGKQADKALYDLLANKEYLEDVGFLVFEHMLSHTNQYITNLEHVKQIVDKVIKKKKVKFLTLEKGAPIDDSKMALTINQHFKTVFKEMMPEEKLALANSILNEFNFKRYTLPYVILGIELANKPKEYVKEQLRNIASNQQAKIHKVISYVEKIKKLQEPKSLLNSLYERIR